VERRRQLQVPHTAAVRHLDGQKTCGGWLVIVWVMTHPRESMPEGAK